MSEDGTLLPEVKDLVLAKALRYALEHGDDVMVLADKLHSIAVDEKIDAQQVISVLKVVCKAFSVICPIVEELP